MAEIAIARGARPIFRLALSVVALSALSFALVFYTAGKEPFYVFRWSELLLIAGLGGIVFALFAAWLIACVRRFSRASGGSALAKVVLSGCVLWAALNLFYLGNSIYGYFQDLGNVRLRHLVSASPFGHGFS